MNNVTELRKTNEELQQSISRLLEENDRLRRLIYAHDGTMIPKPTVTPQRVGRVQRLNAKATPLEIVADINTGTITPKEQPSFTNPTNAISSARDWTLGKVQRFCVVCDNPFVGMEHSRHCRICVKEGRHLLPSGKI